MNRSALLALLGCCLAACGESSGGAQTPDARRQIDARPAVTPDAVPVLDSPMAMIDASAAGQDAAGGTIDAPGAALDAAPALDAPPAIDAAPQIDGPPAILCGNGVVDQGEQCDTAIAQGNPGACPTTCNDNMACTADSLVGTLCQARCVNTGITDPHNDDGCCPPGANFTNDNNCPNTCGDGDVDPGEQCDDSNQQSGDGCSGMCQKEVLAFRITNLELKHPHTFTDALGLAPCSDVTNTDLVVIPDVLTITAINTFLSNLLTTDAAGGGPMGTTPDGLLDVSPVIAFKPFDIVGSTTPVEFVFAECTAPVQTSTCSRGEAAAFPATATNTLSGTGECLGRLAATPEHYSPPIVGSGPPPCFATNSQAITITLAGISLPLQDARIAAVYSGSPTDHLVTGLIRGFLTEAAANANITIQGVTIALRTVLPGGNGNCSTNDDRQFGPDGVTRGWYFYLNFAAVRTPYQEP